jgi:hypothetical protein
MFGNRSRLIRVFSASPRFDDEAMKIATGSDRTYEWAGGRVYRDLFDEQAKAVHNIALALTEVKDD